MADAQDADRTKKCPACAEDIEVDATTCRYCGQEFVVSRVGYCEQCHRQVGVNAAHACPTCGATVIDVVVTSAAAAPTPQPQPVAAVAPPSASSFSPPPPPVAPLPGAPPPPPTGISSKPSGAKLALRIVLVIVAVVVIVVAAIAIGLRQGGTAASPYQLTDKFAQANITCTKLEKIDDTAKQRTLGCVSEDAQIIMVTTFADRPSPSKWASDYCSLDTISQARLGALVTGDGFIIIIIQGPYSKNLFTPPKPRVVANRLATVLGGTASTFNCNTGAGL